MRTEIENWINSKPDLANGTYYLHVLDDADGQPCLRTYALHKSKAKSIRVKEVVRDYLNGEIYMHGDLHWCGAGGYRVMWEERNYSGWWLPCTLDDNWYQIDRRPGMTAYDLYTHEEAENLFKKYIPYFILDDRMCLMEYAIRYQKYASAEQLVKAGYSHLIWDKRVLKMNPNQKKKLIRWLMSDGNGEYVKAHNTLFTDIQKAMKRGLGIERFYYEQCIDNYEESFKLARIKRTRAQCEEIYRYLNNPKKPQNLGLHDYIDYLGMAKQEGFNMREKSVLFPRDVARVHDSIKSKRKAKETKELNKKLKVITEKLLPFEIKSKDLRIVIPTCRNDFVEWGKKLHICVGTYDYDKKMAEGKCIIVMVYTNDQPLECCELQKENGKLRIIQLRGEHNQDSPRHEDCRLLVNKFIGRVGATA